MWAVICARATTTGSKIVSTPTTFSPAGIRCSDSDSSVFILADGCSLTAWSQSARPGLALHIKKQEEFVFSRHLMSEGEQKTARRRERFCLRQPTHLDLLDLVGVRPGLPTLKKESLFRMERVKLRPLTLTWRVDRETTELILLTGPSPSAPRVDCL